MSLLREDEDEVLPKESNKKKKMVLTLLIISIILLVLAIAIVSVLPNKQNNALTLTIDNHFLNSILLNLL